MNELSFDSVKLKKIEIELFLIFKRICEKYNLQYFLLGGSCLGAVRHKGFIPWDDDIDVGMLRDDYDKFMKIAQNELPDNVFLQNYETDIEYPLNFAKLRNSDTTFKETSLSKLNINHGIYIDIFPIDGFTESKFKSELFFFKRRIYSARIKKEFDLTAQKNVKNDIFRILFRKFVYMCFKNLNKIVQKEDKLMRKYSITDSKLAANHCGAWGKKEIMPKDYFGKGTKGVFENIEVILPENYDKYLTSLYGDYMTPPPPEKRVGHHYCTVIDTENSYKNYLTEGVN